MVPTPQSPASDHAHPLSTTHKLAPNPDLAFSVEDLLARVENRTAVIGVVGLGYVGLPLAVELGKAGFSVVGIEVDEARAAQCNAGDSYITDIPDSELRTVVNTDKLKAHTSFDALAKADIIVVCVPTNLGADGNPDLRHVEASSRGIAGVLKPGQAVILESTSFPGTTVEIAKPILEEESGLSCAKDFLLAFSPERVDPGNKEFTVHNTPKVVGASDEASLDVAVMFYNQVVGEVVPVSCSRTAEMVKMFENAFRAVNIGLVNEMAQLCDHMDLDVWEVLDAAFTKPFGIMPFYPGPGVGGHCIPVDPVYLAWKAERHGFDSKVVWLAARTNREMPNWVVGKIERLLEQNGSSMKTGKIVILGVSYKKDIPDCRESPPIFMIEQMQEMGCNVNFHDPFVDEIRVNDGTMQSEDLEESLATADIVVLATDHSCYNMRDIVAKSKHVLDTRGLTRKFGEHFPNVTLL
jgi:UDP-N-acetyl-D-glucosamine dehydrogenase